jgi:hypothetical protein
LLGDEDLDVLHAATTGPALEFFACVRETGTQLLLDKPGQVGGSVFTELSLRYWKFATALDSRAYKAISK